MDDATGRTVYFVRKKGMSKWVRVEFFDRGLVRNEYVSVIKFEGKIIVVAVPCNYTADQRFRRDNKVLREYGIKLPVS